MKRVLIVVVLVIGAASIGLWRSHGGVRQTLSRTIGVEGDGSPGVSGDETRKTFELKPGARVEVQGFNGRVEIQTSDTNTAEVFVRRTGDNPSSLRRRELIIEQTSDGLIVRSKQNHVGIWDHLFGRDPNEEVSIKAPRRIALALRGINGPVFSSDIEGPVEIRGINGRAELGAITESAEIDGINGSIAVGLNRLGERGVHIRGVNGNIELKLAAGLNADLTARGMNGGVKSEIAEVAVEKNDNWSRYSAHIGSGGAPIDISGMNGNVRLTRFESASTAASSAKTTTKDPEKSPTRSAYAAPAKATQ